MKNNLKLILKYVFNILPIGQRNKLLIRFRIERYGRFKWSQRDWKNDMGKELLGQYWNNKISIEQRDQFDERLARLQAKYKKILIVKPSILNIGPMCGHYVYLVELLERLPKNEKIVLMNYDGMRAVYNETDKAIANKYLHKKINHLVEIIDKETASFWGYALQKAPGFILCKKLYQHYGALDPHDLTIHTEKSHYTQRTYFTYTDDEKKKGDEILAGLHLKHKMYYCFFSRSNEYHEFYFKDKDTEQARATSKRNSDVNDFLSAAGIMRDYNIKAVRVGAIDSRMVEATNVVDYTNKARSEFMDFYIMGQAKFFIGDPSGIMQISLLQKIPVALINNFTIFWFGDIRLNNNNNGCYTIFAKWYDKRLKRYLKLREMLNFQKTYGVTDEAEIALLEKLGIEFHKNSPEEITDLTCEINLRIDGNWEETEEMKLLREKYWRMVNGAIKTGDRRLVLMDYEPGSLFLIKNRWWLEE